MFQSASQQKGSCGFNNLSVVTTTDPSQGTCRFKIMIDTGRHDLTHQADSGAAKAAAVTDLIVEVGPGRVLTGRSHTTNTKKKREVIIKTQKAHHQINTLTISVTLDI